MNNINNDNDNFEEKKKSFIEVLRLMEMINTSKSSSNKVMFERMAHIFKDQYDAFISVGFTREEAMQILTAIIGGIGLGGK